MAVHQSEKGADRAHDALLSDSLALADLERLAEMRDACYARPHWPGAIPRYWKAVEDSALRARFAWSEIDHLASVLRTRIAAHGRERIVPVGYRQPG